MGRKKKEDLPVVPTIDPNDCHHIPELDPWLGRRAVIKTSKGTVRGRLDYKGGWYFCQAGERLVDGNWVQTPYRFLFRKGQFRSIEGAPTEGSRGI